MRIICFILLLLPSLTFAQDWHKEQLGTGYGNCGPACSAMLIERSGTPITVQEARAVIGDTGTMMANGYFDGATSLNHLKIILKAYTIEYKLMPFLSFYNSIEEFTGGAFICLVDMIHITNRPYEYAGGHYIVVYGIAEEYYLVMDPLTSTPQQYAIEEIKKAQRGELIYVY